MRKWAALLLLAVLLTSAGECRAGDPPGPRWGVGWEQGLAVKYRPGSGWAYGLRVEPRILDSNTNESTERTPANDDAYSRDERGARETKSLELGLMAYRDAPIGRYAAVGPYVELQYSANWTDQTEQTDQGDAYVFSAWDYTEHRLGLEFGLRPSFIIEERLVLSARLGFRVSWRDLNSTRSSQYPDEEPVEYAHESDTWTFDTLGQNLGLASALAFTIYF